jgi:hypothetical protein
VQPNIIASSDYISFSQAIIFQACLAFQQPLPSLSVFFLRSVSPHRAKMSDDLLENTDVFALQLNCIL